MSLYDNNLKFNELINKLRDLSCLKDSSIKLLEELSSKITYFNKHLINSNKPKLSDNDIFIFINFFSTKGLSKFDKLWLINKKIVIKTENEFETNDVVFVCDKVKYIFNQKIKPDENLKNDVDFFKSHGFKKDYLDFENAVFSLTEEYNGIYSKSFGEICNNGKTFSKNIASLEDSLWHGYMSSGMSGGNCWGGTATSFYNDNVLSEMPHFVPLFKKICPNITFLEFKEINNMVKEDSFTESEYYGNEITYTYFYLKIYTLYKKLKDLGIEIKI